MTRAFSDLSYRGQVRRIRGVALRALEVHGIRRPRVTLIQHSENVMYRVDEPATGRRFALRVHRTDYHSADEVRSELAWLASLSDSGLVVPQPVRAPDGQLLLEVGADGVPPRPCSLLRWVHGRMRHRNRGPRHLYLLGRLLAQLHDHARTWRRPAWFTRKPLGWSELFTDTAVADVDAEQACEAFTPAQRALFDAVRASVDPDELGPAGESDGLIHADLHFANVVFAEGQAHPIDFDDCAIGPWILDIATTLGAVTDAPDYPVLQDALLRGYESHMPLPAQMPFLDRFIAGRFVLLALYVAATAVHNPTFDAKGEKWIAHFFDGARRFMPSS